LRFAHEHNPVPLRGARSHLRRQFIFVLPFLKTHHRNLMLAYELLDSFEEVPRHRLHGVGGGDLSPSLLPDEPRRTFDDL
jgi:hypothetical protein